MSVVGSVEEEAFDGLRVSSRVSIVSRSRFRVDLYHASATSGQLLP